MAMVGCNVLNCSHNDGGNCYANKISVNGKKAHTSTHTCCSSFIDGTNYNSLTNTVNNDDPCNIVACNVRTCSNIAGNVCSLNSVSITSSISKANSNAETYCSSFRSK